MPSNDIAQVFATAINHHQAGRIDQAEPLYREILRRSPHHVDSLNLSGLIAYQRGRHDDAIALFERAIALTRLRPVAQLHNNIAIALRAAGRPDAALGHLRRAVALEPSYADAHLNLGAVLKDVGALEEAEAVCRRSRDLAPRSANAHFALGAVLQDRGRLDQAVACYRTALSLAPDHGGALTNLGGVLTVLGQYPEAITRYRRALALKPDSAEAWFNLGAALDRAGEAEEALACHAKAQALRPDYAEAHWNEALLRLSRGEFAAGWTKYEWRTRLPGVPVRHFDRPAWDGAEAAGETILLHAEQGVGDTLQFIRFARRVREKTGRVIVSCQPGLVALLARSPGIDLVVGDGDAPGAFDRHAALPSLPGLLGITRDGVPVDRPYVSPPPERIAAWRERLGGDTGLKIGLVWRGNPRNTHDRARSIPIDILAPICGVAGIRWFVLQQDSSAEELAVLSRHGAVANVGAELVDWAETAALVSLLDLVVTVDTAIAHLAGAMSKPAWVLLARTAHWCWLTGREDSPWYKSLRLFRQAEAGEWRPVVERAREALASLAR